MNKFMYKENNVKNLGYLQYHCDVLYNLFNG